MNRQSAFVRQAPQRPAAQVFPPHRWLVVRSLMQTAADVSLEQKGVPSHGCEAPPPALPPLPPPPPKPPKPPPCRGEGGSAPPPHERVTARHHAKKRFFMPRCCSTRVPVAFPAWSAPERHAPLTPAASS